MGGAPLFGDLLLPNAATGLVIVVHGNGGGRHSLHHRGLADTLNRIGLGALLLDLLSHAEDRIDRRTAELRFDIPLLTGRVTAAIDWATTHASTASLPIGLFGASTGAAAALTAAARRPAAVCAVVSRGGRSDLAGGALELVSAPTLLIVGSDDKEVVELNRRAIGRLGCPRRLEIVPDATHHFEEPGTMDAASSLAAAWFRAHLH